MYKLSAFILLSVLLTSCTSSPSNSAHQLTGQARPAITPAEVLVYNEPPAQFTEIATVTATSGASTIPSNTDKKADVLMALKAEAAALGANGIILTMLKEDVETDQVPMSNGTQQYVRNVTKYYQTANGIAIYIE